jgi:hypothetical protein
MERAMVFMFQLGFRKEIVWKLYPVKPDHRTPLD